jgi:hypothetical protein
VCTDCLRSVLAKIERLDELNPAPLMERKMSLCRLWHFAGAQDFCFRFGPIFKFEANYTAALLIDFISPAADCGFSLNGNRWGLFDLINSI